MRYLSLSIYCCLLVMMTFASCKKIFKEPTALPNATQEGKNTFGCLVNGKLFYPRGGSYYPSNQIIKTNDEFKIIVQHNHEFIHLTFTPDGTGKVPFCVRYNNTEISCLYEQCQPAIGALIITKYDLQNEIISGHFSFTLAMSSCSGVEVKDGRFDYKFE